MQCAGFTCSRYTNEKRHTRDLWLLSNTLTQTHSRAALSCFFLSQGPRAEALEEINSSMEKNQFFLRKSKRKAFYTAVACEEFRAGAESLLQVSGDMIYNYFYPYTYTYLIIHMWEWNKYITKTKEKKKNLSVLYIITIYFNVFFKCIFIFLYFYI